MDRPARERPGQLLASCLTAKRGNTRNPGTVPGGAQPADRVRGYLGWGENQSRRASDGYCGVFSRKWTGCLSCTSLRYR
jgi:hypothetical protein